MNNCFVTYFDSNYLSRGVTLYESLLRTCENFHLVIVAFDEECYRKLNELNMQNASIVPLDEIEDNELLGVKNTRSRGEYCWTSTPKVIRYVLDNYNYEICTYIDADLFFFSDPTPLIKEMDSEDSVIITAHRYCEKNDYTEMAGKYNVQFMPFRNNDNSRIILDWWNERCIENCSIDLEAGVYGDQKYLDYWTDLFEGVRELRNIGGGVAPWNVDRYTFSKDLERIIIYEKSSKIHEELVFYHFHNIKFFDKNVVNIGDDGYIFPDTAITYIYKRYLREHEKTREKYKLDTRWINQQHFRDDDIDHLIHQKYYFLLELFL